MHACMHNIFCICCDQVMGVRVVVQEHLLVKVFMFILRKKVHSMLNLVIKIDNNIIMQYIDGGAKQRRKRKGKLIVVN